MEGRGYNQWTDTLTEFENGRGNTISLHWKAGNGQIARPRAAESGNRFIWWRDWVKGMQSSVWFADCTERENEWSRKQTRRRVHSVQPKSGYRIQQMIAYWILWTMSSLAVLCITNVAVKMKDHHSKKCSTKRLNESTAIIRKTHFLSRTVDTVS